LKVTSGIGKDWIKAEALGSIAKALSESRESDWSKEVFARALKVTSGIGKDWIKAEALGSIAKALSESGESDWSREVFARALKVTSGIGKDWIKAEVLESIAKALLDAEETDGAREAFTLLLEMARFSGDDWDIARALKSIASALSEAVEIPELTELFSRTLEIASRIKHNPWKHEALGSIAKALLEAEEFALARKMASGIRDKEYKAKVLGSIAQALSEAGETDHSREVFSRTLDAVSGIAEDSVKAESLGPIPLAFRDAKDILLFHGLFTLAQKVTSWIVNSLKELAISLLSLCLETDVGIRDGYYKAKTLGFIAKALSKMGKTDWSGKVFTRALGAVSGIRSDKRKALALKSIGEALLGSVDIPERSALFARILEAASEMTDDWALWSIVLFISEAGQFTRALEVASGIEDDWYKTYILRSILEILLKAGKFTLAMEVASGIAEDWEKAEALGSVAHFLYEEGKIDESRETSILALDVTSGIRADKYKVRLLRNLSEDLVSKDFPLLLENIFSGSIWTDTVWREVLPTWQEALFKAEQPHLHFIRRSLGLYPFHGEMAYGGVFRFFLGLYKAGEVYQVEEIIRSCPQLELEFLLPNLEYDGRTYSNLGECLEALEDEDIKKKITILARKL